MNAGKWLIIALLTAIPVVSTADPVDSEGKWSIGVRAGISAKRTDNEIFQLYEGVADFALPQRYRWRSGWQLRTGISIHAGVMHAGGQTGVIAAVGPNAKLDLPGGIVFLTAGARAGLMSRHTYGDADLGGPFTFETDLGISANLGRNLSAGYRWQHLSNAGIYNENPSINLHALEITYRF